MRYREILNQSVLAIVVLFFTKVKGREFSGKPDKHCGKEGHWLEDRMGIKHNSNNGPDIYGYEMKKYSPKITVGDYSASEYAFSTIRELINRLNNWNYNIKITRTQFIKYFGSPNPKKNGRYSWSGKCVPKYGEWNKNGQTLIVENDDIKIYYSYSRDTRDEKVKFPIFLKKDNLVIAIWKSEKMKEHINKKFNNKGFFMCKKTNNIYDKICFGRPFDFDYFIKCIKNKKIIFDSGMYEGNTRNYSQFRGSGSCFWEELVIEEY